MLGMEVVMLSSHPTLRHSQAPPMLSGKALRCLPPHCTQTNQHLAPLQWRHYTSKCNLQVSTSSGIILSCHLQGDSVLPLSHAVPHHLAHTLPPAPPVPLCQLAAVITYLLCDWFTSNFVLVFVILILLLAFDFWTVKVCVRVQPK